MWAATAARRCRRGGNRGCSCGLPDWVRSEMPVGRFPPRSSNSHPATHVTHPAQDYRTKYSQASMGRYSPCHQVPQCYPRTSQGTTPTRCRACRRVPRRSAPSSRLRLPHERSTAVEREAPRTFRAFDLDNRAGREARERQRTYDERNHALLYAETLFHSNGGFHDDIISFSRLNML